MALPMPILGSLWGFLACVAAVAAVSLLLGWWRGRRFRPVEVLLLLRRGRVRLDGETVGRLARRALGVEVSLTDRSLQTGSLGDEPAFLLPRGAYGLEIHTKDLPPPSPDEKSELREGSAELEEAMRAARAVVGLRVLGRPRKTPLTAVVELGRLLVALLDENAVALARPADGSVLLVDEEFRNHLRGPDGEATFLEIMGHPVPVRANDPALLEAIEEARRRWPEFRRAVREGGPGVECAARVRFEEEGAAEHLWLEVDAVDDELVHGRVRSEPTVVRTEIGATLSAPVEAVTDWSVIRDGERTGAFTEAVIRKRFEEMFPPPGKKS